MPTPATTTSVSVIEIDSAQPRIEAILSTLLPNTEKGKRTIAVVAFIAKDLRTYSVENDTGFHYLLKTTVLCYKIPPQTHFTENVIPALYHGIKSSDNCVTEPSKSSRNNVRFMDFSQDGVYVIITAHYVSKD